MRSGRGRGPGPARRDRARPGRRDRRRPRRRHPRRPDRRAGRARAPTLDGLEEVDAEGLHAFPAFFDPHVHLRTPGQEHKEDIETGSRAAAAGGYCGILAMANTEPPVCTAADVEALREAAREAASRAGRLPRHGHPRHGGRGADRDGRAARRRRGRLQRRRPADPQRPGAAPRPPVPAALRRHDRPARGGPRALRRRRHARGPGLGRARPGRHPLGLGVDDDRPRRGAGRLRGRPDPRPAPLRRRVGRGGARRQGRRRADQLRGQPAPPLPHRRGGAQPRPAPLQDEPAAALRGRPPGADRGPARRHDRLRRHRPRPARDGGKGGPLRAGGDGGDRAGDGLRRAAHRAGPARHDRARPAGRADGRRRRALRPRAADPGAGQRGQRRPLRPRRRVDGRRGRLREPLAELLVRRPQADRPGADDPGRRPGRLPAAQLRLGVARRERRGYLLLEDGTRFDGVLCGARRARSPARSSSTPR